MSTRIVFGNVLPLIGAMSVLQACGTAPDANKDRCNNQADCLSGFVCNANQCIQDARHSPSDVNGEVPANAKRIFVTSTSYNGNLGGIEGADAKCADAASSASLGGTWKAWLSTDDVSALDRLADVGPWYTVTRTTKLFDNKASISRFPLSSIDYDQLGRDMAGDSWFNWNYAWTGTTRDGVANKGHTCGNWSIADRSATGGCGQANAVNHLWTESCDSVCSIEYGLICFEQ